MKFREVFDELKIIYPLDTDQEIRLNDIEDKLDLITIWRNQIRTSIFNHLLASGQNDFDILLITMVRLRPVIKNKVVYLEYEFYTGVSYVDTEAMKIIYDIEVIVDKNEITIRNDAKGKHLKSSKIILNYLESLK